MTYLQCGIAAYFYEMPHRIKICVPQGNTVVIYCITLPVDLNKFDFFKKKWFRHALVTNAANDFKCTTVSFIVPIFLCFLPITDVNIFSWCNVIWNLHSPTDVCYSILKVTNKLLFISKCCVPVESLIEHFWFITQKQ